MSYKILKGYTLIFAIVVIIIITAISLLILTFFRLNFLMLDKVELGRKASLYCYEGLNIAGASKKYDVEADFLFENQLRVVTCRKRWGAYDLYYSTVVKGKSDTLTQKIALIGFSHDTTASLLLRNNSSIVSLGDSTVFSGKCYFPSGIFRTFMKRSNIVSNAEVLVSPDTLPRLNNLDTVNNWKTSSGEDGNDHIEVIELLFNSFSSKTRIISGDTIHIVGDLSGNIIVRARHVVVDSNVNMKDIIILTGSISFPNNFRGSLQVFARHSIVIGKNAVFSYPSVICVFPDALEQIDALNQYYITAEDSFCFAGEILAYTSRYTTSQRVAISLKGYSKTVGGIYSSGTFTYRSLESRGSIICDKIVGIDRNAIKVNLISKATIYEVPNRLLYSTLFPNTKKKKIAAWLK